MMLSSQSICCYQYMVQWWLLLPKDKKEQKAKATGRKEECAS